MRNLASRVNWPMMTLADMERTAFEALALIMMHSFY